MLRCLLLLVLAQISWSLFCQTTSSDPELDKTETQFFEALRSKDYTNLESFYDDSFTGVLPTGQILNKTAMVQHQKTSDSYILKSFEEMKLRVYGDIAISTGIEVNKVKSGTRVGQLRFLRVLVKKNDTWKVIDCQYTVIL